MPSKIRQRQTKLLEPSLRGLKRTGRLSFQPLNKTNNSCIDDFDCGEEHLNNFLKKKALREQEKNFSRVFLGFDNINRLVSFFSLNAASIKRSSLPRGARPPYLEAPSILLGRLAVDSRYQSDGYGTETLLEVLSKYLEVCSITGSVALLVEAYKGAVRFYKKFKFEEIKEPKKDQREYTSMYLLTETIINEF